MQNAVFFLKTQFDTMLLNELFYGFFFCCLSTMDLKKTNSLSGSYRLDSFALI